MILISTKISDKGGISMKYQYDLFISYSTQNTDVANYLVEKIEKRGFKCFIAPRDISVSSEYAKTIIDGIGNSTAILLIFSSASDNSRYVISEINAAASRNKPIIPVRIENIIPSESMEFYLGPTQWLDAFPEISEVHLDKIISVLSGFDNNRNNSSTIRLNQKHDNIMSQNMIAENLFYKGLHIYQNANLTYFFQENKADFQNYSKDINLAVELFQKAADAGNAEAMFYLSICYNVGSGVVKNYEKAFEWLKKSAEAKSIHAMFLLSEYYYKGIRVPKDDTKAFEWEKKAAEAGHVPSMSNLAVSYIKGEGVIKDTKKAFQWFKKAAEAGDVQSMYNLAFCYSKGEGVSKNASKAFQWYKEAANKGYILAMYDLAVCYINGDGVSKDASKAFQWFQKAAILGHSKSIFEVAMCYFDGEGTPKDYTKAFQWFQKAAEKNDSKAMHNLAFCYECGLGVQKDASKAFQWLQKAADAGNVDSINTLKNYYSKNTLSKDLCAETKTKDANLPEVIPNANETQSFKDLQKNAESGDPNAMFKLARMYEFIDKTQAVLWYKKAADAGHNRSMFILGAKCQSGLGVEQNISLAFYWFEKAAKNNNTMAMCQLGDMYYKGEGVPKDKSQAFYWFKKAADNGSDEATNKLTKINQSGDSFLNSLSRIWQNMIK